MSPAARFLDHLAQSLYAKTFRKLTLSSPRDDSGDEPRNLYARAIDTKEGTRLQLVWRHPRRDITKTLPFGEGLAALREAIPARWERGNLLTATGDWALRCDPQGEGQLKAQRPTSTAIPSRDHDRQKPAALDPAASLPFLHALGVTDATGAPRPAMADKLRQIQRFVELLGHVLEGANLADAKPLKLVDMGAGKGYLTFAAAQYLRGRGIEAEIVGVEARAELVDLGNEVAIRTGFAEQLRFEVGEIGNWQPAGEVHFLMALHACNTATDDALFKGIRAGAAVILASPCCHQELRPLLAIPRVLAPVLRHGTLLERESEILTDGLRALLLEMHGYRAQVFEFISPEHTGKNLMISAHRLAQPANADARRAEFHALCDFYGVHTQRLAALLGELPSTTHAPLDPA